MLSRNLTALCAWLVLTGCANPSLQTVAAFRDAKKRGDVDTAKSYLVDDPRVLQYLT